MSMTISHTTREELMSAILQFIDSSTRWANWALNVFPLLCPALQSSYSKIAGKTLCNASISLNRAVICDLAWFANHVHNAHGSYFFVNKEWEFVQANLIILCDASMVGLGFYVPAKALSFASGIPSNPLISNIHFYEALRVASAIARAAALPTPLHCLLVYTVFRHDLCDFINTCGATALALAGISDSAIQAMSRWSSDTWRIHIQKHPVLLQALMHGHSVFQIPSLTTTHSSLPTPSRE
ncbi:hypothetical protein M422DRAFT_261376 [Sphaerobolus stellatus SS14]|uniref:Uncharacterized protein n=1 Tax=Sphaerobolus stellatus (strain SS14) TaxID=990650 RepID=A0A0C9VF36_SPHS4|nr:hypothetical protein M422DRAFT_261376 [Sphaerobolus stellatus SS14]